MESERIGGAVQACLSYFEKAKAHEHAKEVLLKLDDIEGLIQLQLEANKWEEALMLLQKHPQYAAQVRGGLRSSHSTRLPSPDRFSIPPHLPPHQPLPTIRSRPALITLRPPPLLCILLPTSPTSHVLALCS